MRGWGGSVVMLGRVVRGGFWRLLFYFCLLLFLPEISGALRGGELTEATQEYLNIPAEMGGSRKGQWEGGGNKKTKKAASSATHSCPTPTVTRERGVKRAKMSVWLLLWRLLCRRLWAQPQSAQRCGGSEGLGGAGAAGEPRDSATPLARLPP